MNDARFALSLTPPDALDTGPEMRMKPIMRDSNVHDRTSNNTNSDHNDDPGYGSNGDEHDSALGDVDIESESIDLVVELPREENGRTYHRYREDIGYLLPNDQAEQERLRKQHKLFQETLHRNYLSPIEVTVRKILDAGTGLGCWAMDIADMHPEADVIGLDLSPIQPAWVPPNLKFYVDDVESDWFDDDLSFVFARTLGIRDWPKFIRQSFKCLAKEGWLEIQDIIWTPQGHLDKGSIILEWAEKMEKGMRNAHRSANSAVRYKQQLLEGGFVKVEERLYEWPIHPWAEDRHHQTLGFLSKEVMMDHLEGLSLAPFTRHLGMSRDEVYVFLAHVRRAMLDPNARLSWQIRVVYGQKPAATNTG